MISLRDINAALADAQNPTTDCTGAPHDWDARLVEVAGFGVPGGYQPVGDESAPTTAVLTLAARTLGALHRRGVDRPGIYPLTEGGVQFEWPQVEVSIPNDGEPVVDHACDYGDFDRTVCPEPCDTMHSYCTLCGTRRDGCLNDTAGTLPDQPDGIDPDSRQLPQPAAAAERVCSYVRGMGDGLYDTAAGAPLYARDLEALCRAVVDTQTILDDLRSAHPEPARFTTVATVIDRLAHVLGRTTS